MPGKKFARSEVIRRPSHTSRCLLLLFRKAREADAPSGYRDVMSKPSDSSPSTAALACNMAGCRSSGPGAWTAGIRIINMRSRIMPAATLGSDQNRAEATARGRDASHTVGCQKARVPLRCPARKVRSVCSRSARSDCKPGGEAVGPTTSLPRKEDAGFKPSIFSITNETQHHTHGRASCECIRAGGGGHRKCGC
jgi:hypothetical protein